MDNQDEFAKYLFRVSSAFRDSYIDKFWSSQDNIKALKERRKQERAQRRAEKFQAGEAAADAAYARYLAGFLREEGKSAAAETRRETGLEVGRARNLFGRSGADVNVGTPALLAEAIRASGEYDALIVRTRAEIDARKQEYQARASDRAFTYHMGEALMPLSEANRMDEYKDFYYRTRSILGI